MRYTDREWDVVVVGAGHNGLTCAAYLAEAGKRVLVLEAREYVGGACSVRESWPGYRLSPCAYLCGLLHPRVIADLDLPARGFSWTPADTGMFVPFEDGTSIQLWEDRARCENEVERFAPGALSGWRAMGEVMDRLRDKLRPDDERDLWLNPAPSREDIEDRLAGDPDARALLYDWSMAEYVERFLDDERLQIALLGQGVIGTNASPFDRGTASVNFHHSSGRLGGSPGQWGYVKGGIGEVSRLIAEVAESRGVEICTGVSVGCIRAGEGVETEAGEVIRAPVVVSNADPITTLRLLEHVDPDWQAQVEAVPITGCTLKMNVALSELPNFIARPGTNEVHHRGQINTPLSKQAWKDAFADARSGKLPDRLWTELYFQSAVDHSIVPEGMHSMSVFAQYVPHTFVEGDWDLHREAAGDLAIESVAHFCGNLTDIIVHRETKGPVDIEESVGLHGGHIFQGECLPDFMWDRRLSSRTPMEGVYLCGACTHPGGSVIAVNGRNCALEILS